MVLPTTLRRRTAPPLQQSLAQEMDQLQASIRRMFDDPSLGLAHVGLARPIDWLPSVEIRETGEAIVLTAELPGIDPREVHVSLEDNVLTIRGEKKEEVGEDAGQYRVSERSYGAFERAFTLPPTVDRERINAEYTNGLLKLVLPKMAPATLAGREIPVVAK